MARLLKTASQELTENGGKQQIGGEKLLFSHGPNRPGQSVDGFFGGVNVKGW